MRFPGSGLGAPGRLVGGAILVAALVGTVTAASWPADAAGEAGFCSIHPPIEFSAKRTRAIVLEARAIVRATAIGVVPPSPGSKRPDLTYMAFDVREVLTGNVPDTLRFIGYPDDQDSFSEEAVPYLTYFRWRGGGDCIATSYRPGAEYLLLLGDSRFGLDPYWAFLAPTNEQIRGPDDPWVAWVRQVLASPRAGRR